MQASVRRGLLLLAVLTAGLATDGQAQQRIVVTATGTQRSLAPYFLGFVTETTFGPSWSDPSFLAAIPLLAPEALRFPGGQNGNYWDWQNGWFLASSGYNAGVPPNYYRLQDLKNAVQRTGATPDYMINMLTSDLPTQVSMLRSARDVGLPVSLIELGNEFSLNVPAYVAKFPTGNDYGLAANEWINAIRSEFPQARIAISTRTGINQKGGTTREQTWNQQVLGAVHMADAVIMHTYPSIETVVTVPLDNSDPETLQQQTAETTALQDPSVVPNALGVPFDAYAEVEGDIQALPAGFTPTMRVWITEYDLSKVIYAAHGTWLHGLFAGALTALYMQDSRIELIDFFNMCDGALHGAIFRDNDSFRLFLNPAPTQTYGLSAAGTVVRQFSRSMTGMTTAHQLVFTPSPSVARNGASYPALLGWTLSDGVRRTGVILNLGVVPVTLDLSDATMRPLMFEQLAASPLARITGLVGPQMSTGPVSLTLIAPAYSVTRLSWQTGERHHAVRH